MKQYLDILRHVIQDGSKRDDRTGTGTIGIFGLQARYRLTDGFPAVTTKRLWFKGVVHELLWLLSGNTNIKYLQDNNVHIWDEWTNKEGDLGPVYGKQWRRWDTSGQGYYAEVDQIKEVIEAIKKSPYSRRHVVSAWNIKDLSEMALPPCHNMFQFYVDNNRLSCMFNMRSCDLFLGCPFNIASYALLTHMVAQVCGLDVGNLIHTIGDGHIYLNHLSQVGEQLKRVPLDLPKLWLNPEIKNIDDFRYEDIKLIGYNSHPSISAPIAV